jgi:polar amino acid transport system substrate-binding protein
VACRNPAFITSADLPGLRGLGLWLRDALGLDLSILHDPFDAKRYAWGVWLSMWLCAASMAGALLLGYLGARVALSGRPFWAGLARLAASLGRSTPLLLQMYFLYFGLGAWLVLHTGWGFSPLWVAVLCLSAHHGAMILFTLTESVRVVRQSRPDFALTLRSLPPVLVSASVGIKVALTNLTKASVIASAIAVPELLAATTAIIADRGNTALMMNLMLVSFFLLTAFWTWVIELGERRVRQRWAGVA